MSGKTVSEKKLRYMEYLSRETGDRHHTDTQDMLQYELLKAGDPRAVEEAVRMFSSDLPGHVSDDPVRNNKYLFVACITLACRFVIAGGMDAERAYNISDLYIRKLDLLQTVEAIRALHAEMFQFYVDEMAGLERRQVYSKRVTLCLDFIYEHLHEQITLKRLADCVGLNRSYLSTLFKRETGISVTEYILKKRIEAAKNMLRFSDDTYAQISVTLAFSSQSHFTRVFREQTGYTPKTYRDRFFRQ